MTTILTVIFVIAIIATHGEVKTVFGEQNIQ